ncbi:MAG: trypsin-like peptidase domain-containing protein [Myxococcales bacterium]|nr:trypsin-like peptidase domain-containing protein [Myxococcales bacterium]
MHRKITLIACLLGTACAVGTAEDRTHVVEGRTWVDQGLTPRTSRHAVDDTQLQEAPDTLEIVESFVDGVLLDAEDGHEYFADALDEETRAALRAAYDETLDVEEPEREALAPRILGADGRTRITARSNNPYRGIGRYTMQWADDRDACRGVEGEDCEASCTGTLIGSRYVAIAAHCVYDRGDNAWIFGNVGATRGSVCFKDGATTVCRDVVARKVSPTWAGSNLNRARHDYALLKLSSSPGLYQMGLSSISSASSLRDLTVRQHGYPGEPPSGASPSVDQLWGMTSCSITDVASDRLSYNCDTTGGHSGGPVYYRTSGGSFYLLAIHSGGATFANTGARVAGSDTRDWLVAEMAGW